MGRIVIEIEKSRNVVSIKDHREIYCVTKIFLTETINPIIRLLFRIPNWSNGRLWRPKHYVSLEITITLYTGALYKAGSRKSYETTLPRRNPW